MPPIIAAAATKWSQSSASSVSELHVLRVALDELVPRVAVVDFAYAAVLAEVVDAHDLCPASSSFKGTLGSR